LLSCVALACVAKEDRSGRAVNADSARVEVERLSTMSGISLPSSARIMLAEGGGRDAADYRRWVVRSPGTIEAPSEGRVEVPVEAALRVIEPALGGERIGKPTGTTAQSSEWSNANGRWRSTIAVTETGHYLDLERLQGPAQSP
jgi:hypothetical protein